MTQRCICRLGRRVASGRGAPSDQLGLAQYAIDGFEGDRGVIGKDLRVIQGIALRLVDRAVIPGPQIDQKQNHDQRAQEHAEGRYRMAWRSNQVSKWFPHGPMIDRLSSRTLNSGRRRFRSVNLFLCDGDGACGEVGK